MRDPKLEPASILRVFGQGVLEALDVALALELPRDHEHRYRDLQERLELMCRAGWLASHVGADGRTRYMAAYTIQLALPPALLELLERAARRELEEEPTA